MEMPATPEVRRWPQPNFKWIILAALIILALAALTYYYLPGMLPEKQLSQGPVVVINDLVLTGTAIVQKGQLLLPVDIIKTHLDKNLHWDPDARQVTVTTENKVIRMQTEQLTAYINSKPVQLDVPVILVDGKPFIPVEFLADLYRIKVTKLPERNTFIFDKDNTPVQTAKVSRKSTTLRSGPSIREPVRGKLKSGDTLLVFAETNGWLKVRTDLGQVGYVSERHVTLEDVVWTKAEPEETKVAWKPLGGKINLTWEQVNKVTPDMRNVPPMEGVNVVSPTWFSLADAQGNIKNKADLAYVTWAHRNNFQVWALVDNQFDPDLTGQFLANPASRQRAIDQLLVLAELYDLDGINIDFENIHYEDKDLLVQFIRELTPYLHEQGLTVSMDVTVISQSKNWSLVYDREALGQTVDYLMLMTYDEHWAGSPEAGSVASLPWVERAVQRVLELVPREKLVLGVPFYTRLWKETVQDDGSIEVSSQALSMDEARQILEKHNASVVFDRETGQYYGEYELKGSKYRVWLETEESMRQRIELVKKYDLAGVASWRRGYESKEIWPVIAEVLSKRP